MVRTKGEAKRTANHLASPGRDDPPFPESPPPPSPVRSPPPPPPPREDEIRVPPPPASPSPSPPPMNDPPFVEEDRVLSPSPPPPRNDPVVDPVVDDKESGSSSSEEESGSSEEESGSSEEESGSSEEESGSLGEDGSEANGSEEGARKENETNDEPWGVMQPQDFFIKKDQYSIPVKIGTRCYIAETVDAIEKVLNKDELQWFLDHPQFHHFFHMPRDANHKSMAMWILIQRMARTNKRKELWFVVNGVPIRYAMREHALISGLFCHDFPSNHLEIGNKTLVDKHFKNVKKVTQEMVKTKFMSMKTPTADRLKMAVLFFLTNVIKGNAKRGKDAPAVDPFLQRIVTKLDTCESFPWGRFTFFDTLDEIGRMVDLFEDGVVKRGCNLPSFITPMELLAFEAIPSLRRHFMTDVEGANSRCPKMCKSKFKSGYRRGISMETIYKELGETIEIESIIEATLDERLLIADLEEEDDDEDPVVHTWNRRLFFEKQPLFFPELCKEDIEKRTKVVEEPTAVEDEEATVGETASGGVVGVKEFMELRDIIVSGFKDINEKLESTNERLGKLELLVSEANVGKEDDKEDDKEEESESEDEESEEEGEDAFDEDVAQDDEAHEDVGTEKGNEDGGGDSPEAELRTKNKEDKKGGKTGKRKRSYSSWVNSPFGKPRTRQRTKEMEG